MLKKLLIGGLTVATLAGPGLVQTASANDGAAFAAGVAVGAATSKDHHRHVAPPKKRCHLEWRHHRDGRRYQVKVCHH